MNPIGVFTFAYFEYSSGFFFIALHASDLCLSVIYGKLPMAPSFVEDFGIPSSASMFFRDCSDVVISKLQLLSYIMIIFYHKVLPLEFL